MADRDLQIEIESLLAARNWVALREMLLDLDPPDVGGLISEITSNDRALFFRLLPQRKAAEIFAYLDISIQEELLKALGQNEVALILNDMSQDDRTHLLEELPAEVTKRLLVLLTPEELQVAQTLLGYPPNSVGRLMTSDFIAVKSIWTIQESLDYIRKHGQNSETLDLIYVTDDVGTLIDDIRVSGFLLTPTDRMVETIMDRTFVSLNASDEQETAIEIFKRYDRVALPVTDQSGVLIGIVTIDDIIDVAEEEATEDIQKIGGSEALTDPYMDTHFLTMIRKRAGWLAILFVGETLTATAMGFYQHQISKAVILALFIPLIISSGGNSGSQAATLIIRALALGEIKLLHWWKIMRRELMFGVMLGAILGLIGFVRISVWSTFSDIYGEHWLLLATTVATALIGVVIWGTLIGSMLPLILKRLGLDPATSSAPFVATLVDVTGIVIYFALASVILRGTLL